MCSRNRKLTLATCVGMGLFSVAANADPGKIDCTDHEHRYSLSNLVKSDDDKHGSITYIDASNRMQIVRMKLTCDFNSSQSNRVEIFCASSHTGGEDAVIRARVHAQTDSTLPQIALVEIHNGTIDDVIPLICQ